MTGDNKVQTDKFKAAARDLGCDESEERFDAALGKIVKHKPTSTSRSDEPTKTSGPKPKNQKTSDQ